MDDSEYKSWTKWKKELLIFDDQFQEMPSEYRASISERALKWRLKRKNQSQRPDEVERLCDSLLELSSEQRKLTSQFDKQGAGRLSYLSDEAFVIALTTAFDAEYNETNFHHSSVQDICITLNESLIAAGSTFTFTVPTFKNWWNKFFEQKLDWFDDKPGAKEFFFHVYRTYKANKSLLSQKLDDAKSHVQKDVNMFWLKSKFDEYEKHLNPTGAGNSTNVNLLMSGIKLELPKGRDLDSIEIITTEDDE